MSITVIETAYDDNMDHWVLWHMGNYHYEVENRNTGYKVPLYLYHAEDSLALAKETFYLQVNR